MRSGWNISCEGMEGWEVVNVIHLLYPTCAFVLSVSLSSDPPQSLCKPQIDFP